MISINHKEAFYQNLLAVQTPGQYIGNERNAIHKDHDTVEVKWIIAFPDTYSIGMSNLGTRILYDIINKRSDAVAERAFHPWPDMMDKMREGRIPLLSMESKTPVKHFDFIGFSMNYENCYPAVLNMIDLAGIAVFNQDRCEEDPILIGGGPCALSPQPMSPFLDLFAIGDGEELVEEMTDQIKTLRHLPRQEKVYELAKNIKGLYAPDFYEERYKADGTIEAIKPTRGGLPEVIEIRYADLEQYPLPTAPVVPNVKVVQDRICLEIMRGCTHGCRFCQAGMVKRPVRIRSVKDLVDTAWQSYQNTGYDGIALHSLSSSNYPYLKELVAALSEKFQGLRVDISMPSLHVDDQLVDMPDIVGEVRRSGLTMAPETGSDRMRKFINKDISNDHLIAAAKKAYEKGHKQIKLYFMIGHPGETDEDILEGLYLSQQLSELRREVKTANGKNQGPARINVGLAVLVPKPHTPFQWSPMDNPKSIAHKKQLLLKKRGKSAVFFRFNGTEESYIEGMLALGDRRVSKVIYRAWQLGAHLEPWREFFSYPRWQQAFKDTGIDPAFWIFRKKSYNEFLPWDHIFAGVTKKFLVREMQKAEALLTTENCMYRKCFSCGTDCELPMPLWDITKQQGIHPAGIAMATPTPAHTPETAETAKTTPTAPVP